ncbi:MAG: universal stress protein [Euryarchaeota archaeon]|nr:universal stress protein [Euryarchaeota archaeon]
MNEEDNEHTYDDVLVSVSNPENAKNLIRLATLITTPRATLHILTVTRKQTTFKRDHSWRQGSNLVIEATRYANKLGWVAMPIAKTLDSVPKAIINTAKEVDADLLLLGWFKQVRPISVESSEIVNNVMCDAPHNMGVLKPRTNLLDIKKVLVPITELTEDALLHVVDNILQNSGADGELIHVITKDSERRKEMAEKVLSAKEAQFTSPVKKRIIRSDSVTDGLTDASKEGDLIVIGATPEWRFSEFLFGRIIDRVADNAQCSVLIYKSKKRTMERWTKALIRNIKQKVTFFLLPRE